MESDKSISQGAFLTLPPGFNLSKLRRRKKLKVEEDETMPIWELSFTNTWQSIESDIKSMNEILYQKVLKDLVAHIGSLKWEDRTQGAIPCELLLTGTNLPDHKQLLDALTRQLKANTTQFVATLWAGEAAAIKTTIQSLVKQIINAGDDSVSDYEDSEDEYDDDEEATKRSRRSKIPAAQLSLGTLSAWYQENAGEDKKPLVIILPDFESFSSSVLSSLVSLLCAYDKVVPFVLVLGVATSPSAVYQRLPRSTLSLLVVKLFQSEASPTLLNHVIEKIFLSEKCPFRLGSQTMTFLVDVFLFNSFSVQRFVQGYKFCMMEHFYEKDFMALCCSEEEVESTVSDLSKEDVENIRRFVRSFQRHVEKCELPERRKLLLDDKYTKVFLKEKLDQLHSHISDFHTALKCLNLLARDLPGTPLGKQVREVYCSAVSSEIIKSKEYKQTLSILEMQAKAELSAKVAGVLDILQINNIADILSEDKVQFDPVIASLEKVKKELDSMGQGGTSETNGETTDPRKKVISILDKDLFEPFLVPPESLVLHEILYFDDVRAVRRRIAGAPKTAIHNALFNPQTYLRCECCVLPHPEAVTPSLPDISIAYKLYLESNRLIKLDDWLKSFSSIVNQESQSGIDEEVRSRFKKSVSELQFLGFIKPSKTNQNQVTKLTFGSF